MATSKTLTPTNVTIQIPGFTDQPDQRVNSDCIDKEADAINALNSKITISDVSFSSVPAPGAINSSIFKKQGSFRYLYLEIVGWDLITDTVLAVIKSEDRPSTRKVAVVNVINSSVTASNGVAFVVVNTNGNVTITSLGVNGQRFAAVEFYWTV